MNLREYLFSNHCSDLARSTNIVVLLVPKDICVMINGFSGKPIVDVVPCQGRRRY